MRCATYRAGNARGLLLFILLLSALASCVEPSPDLTSEESVVAWILASRTIEDVEKRINDVKEAWPTGGRYEWTGKLDSQKVADGYVSWNAEIWFSAATPCYLTFYADPSHNIIDGFALKNLIYGREDEQSYFTGYRDEKTLRNRRISIYQRLSVPALPDSTVDSILNQYRADRLGGEFSYGCGYVATTPEIRTRLWNEVAAGRDEVARALLVSFDPQRQLYGLEAWLVTSQRQESRAESADRVRQLLEGVDIAVCSGCNVWSESAEEFAASIGSGRLWMAGYQY